MGVSFKVSRVGRRYGPKPSPRLQPDAEAAVVSNSSEGTAGNAKGKANLHKHAADDSSVSSDTDLISTGVVSVVLHLFADGYSIGKPSENENVQDLKKSSRPYNRASQSLFSAIECGQIPGDILDDFPCKYIDGSIICEVRDHRNSVSQKGPSTPTICSPVVTKVKLKISLENIVRDIPLISDSSWTYGDLMEVESRILKALQPKLCLDPTPKFDKLCNEPIPPKLKMALSSACKKRLRELPEISVTLSNTMHSKKSCIDRVQESSDSGMVSSNAMQQNALDNIPAQNVGMTSTMNASPRGLITDASFSGLPLIAHQQIYPMMVGNSRGVMNWGAPAPSSAQEMIISYSDNNQASPSLHGKRETQEGAMSPSPSGNTHKRVRSASGIHDANQLQQLGQKMDNLHGSDMNWKNSLLQQQVLARGIQHPNAVLQKYPQQYPEGMLKTELGVGTLPSGFQGIRHASVEEHIDAQKLVGAEPVQGNKNEMSSMEIDKDRLDLQQQNQLPPQRVHQNPLMRSGFSQAQWSSMNQHFENNLKREEQLQKRKTVQSPRVSAGALAQSPLSSKSGEFSSGSLGPVFGAVVSNQMTGISYKDKSVVTSVPTVGGAGSITSSGNDSAQRQNIAQTGGGKRRSNSLTKTPAITGVGSPASVSNISVPLSANSPSISTSSVADQSVLERFSKIEMVTMRHQLNRIKSKADDCTLRKPEIFPTESLMSCLSKISSIEDFKDNSCTALLSKSLLGGSMNTCKTRLLTCVLGEHRIEGGDVPFIPAQSGMILSEKPSNGTVAIAYGDMEEGDVLDAEDHLPTLPTTHLADLLVEQFKSLMEKDGYRVTDHTQLKMIHMNHQPTNNRLTNLGIPSSDSTGQIAQYPEGVSAQAPNEILSAGNGGNVSLNQSQNLLANSRILPPPNPQALQMSQGLMPGASMTARPQQMDMQQKLQQPLQQQPALPQNQNQVVAQQPQFPRPSMMLNSNPLSLLNAIGQNSNIQMGDPMNKTASLQLHHLLQQQQQRSPQQNQQQQQTSQMQRKMMMGIDNMGMGNIGSNLAGFPGLGNAMGMGGPRGVVGSRISSPMGAMSSLGSVGQNQMNLAQASSISNAISQGLHSGNLTPTNTAAFQKFRMMHQNQANMLGGPQSGTGGVPGARQMSLGSGGLPVLGPATSIWNNGPTKDDVRNE
ncbi:hypothetical protein SAY86_013646 [Trapa natans]|uniref:Uncharacterized protein n=1 Tax=Trapa natans TaxID=22666 RepID=A0AAN7QMS8_TRANT|nr:hypothetical protein SAY86_013646 [Trapa natans]